MQLFACQGCSAELHFENSQCLTCGRAVGFLQDSLTISALESGASALEALAENRAPYRYCENSFHGACNWLIPASSPDHLCEACSNNRTIPDLGIPANVTRWASIELAKHKVFRSLLRWRLPHPTKFEDPERGLAFDFLADPPAGSSAKPVMTGHDNGLITLALVEGDDAEREKRRAAMGEPYRTLVGHFRHELGHYYWDRLVKEGGRLDDYRALFGDERQDYAQALQRHYREGARPDWPLHFISAYASSHPWEDFAETWAHYFHIVDALETAQSYGIVVRARPLGPAQPVELDFNPYHAPSAARLVEAWVPFSVALNGVNRSMGHADLYPFVLNRSVEAKLEFVHQLIHRQEAAEQAKAA